MLTTIFTLLTTQLASDAQLLELNCPGNATDNWGRYAAAYSAFSDWDGDGVNDLLVGAPLENMVRIRSGHTGTVLFEVSGSSHPANARFGRVVQRAGDLNGDGVEDIFVNTLGQVAEIRSGSDGAILHALSIAPSEGGFVYFEPMPDIDGDGISDFLLGVPNTFCHYGGDVATFFVGSLPARVEVRSGASGVVLSKTEDVPGTIGAHIVQLGDLDGDGLADIGAGNGYLDEISGAGMFGYRALSSVTGQTLWSIPYRVVASVRLSDIDGDGVDDVAMGTDEFVIARSGVDGAYLWGSAGHYFSDFYGTALDTLDFNGDGVLDVLVGAHQQIGTWGGLGGGGSYHEEGYVEVLDGATGLLLFRFDGDDEAEGFGAGVVSMGDTNGDGAPDFVVASAIVTSGTPRLQWLSAVPATLTSDVFAISLSAGGTQSFDVNMGLGHMGELALLLGSVSGHGPGLSWGGGLLPLTTDAYLIQRLNVPKVTILDNEGRGSIALTVPPGFAPGLAGLVLHHAYVSLDTANQTVTGASSAIPTTLLQ